MPKFMPSRVAQTAFAFAITMLPFSLYLSSSGAQVNPPDMPCHAGTAPAVAVKGTVTDEQGGLLPGASVSLSCGSVRKSTLSDSAGQFILDMSPGVYVLSSQAPGFAVVRRVVSIAATAQTEPLEVKMPLGSTSSTVTVMANPDYVADTTETGTKTRTPLIDSAQSVSVVTSMQMEARDVQTVDQAVSYTAGVDTEPYGDDPRVDWFFIRGFAENDDAVYLDGLGTSKIYAFESQFMVSPYSLQSVDIMKGPSSVLYGTNLPGGLINLVSKQPQPEFHNEVRFEGGTFSRYQGSIDSTGPLNHDATLAYRLTGQVRSSGSQVQFAQDDLVYAEPSLLWKPDGKTTLTILSNFTEARQGSIAQFLPAQGTLYTNPNGMISTHFFGSDPSFDKYQKELYFVGYSLRRELAKDWVFRQNFRFSHMTTFYKALYGIGIESDLRTLDRASLLGDVNVAHYALDNELQGNFRTAAIRHTVLLGGEYQRQNDLTQYGYNGYDYEGEVPSIDLYHPVYGVAITPPSFNANNATETLQQPGVYAQDQLQWGKWVSILSGREDWAPQHLNDKLNVDVINKDDSKFTGHAGLLYHSSFGLAPYFSYATSFDPTAGLDPNGKPYLPTTGNQYEIGAKYQPTRFNAFLTASLFSLTENNVLTTDPSNVQLQIQAGQVRSRGLELEGTASLLFNLNLVSSYTHDQVLYTVDFSGMQDKRPVYTPMNTESTWLDYTPHHFGIGAGARFIGLTYGDPANTIVVPGHTVMDAEMHYSAHGVRYAFSSSNLLNNVYVSYCYLTVACNYGALRTMTGTLTFDAGALFHPFHKDR
jgi:iron complex outermembrane recepter protein